MAYVKREWKGRLAEFMGRRRLNIVSKSSDEQTIVADVYRNEGLVSQAGDQWSPENMNDMEQRIEDGFNGTVDKDNILDKEGVEANTELGKYVADALVVKELSNNLQGFTPIVDETTGRITGYKTKVGADTVFPFSSERDFCVPFQLRMTLGTHDISKKLYLIVRNGEIYVDDSVLGGEKTYKISIIGQTNSSYAYVNIIQGDSVEYLN